MHVGGQFWYKRKPCRESLGGWRWGKVDCLVRSDSLTCLLRTSVWWLSSTLKYTTTSRPETGVQYISWSQGHSTSHSPLWHPCQSCKGAKLQAGIKPTALCSAIDKENLIESPLDFATLYIQLLSWLCTLSPTVLMPVSWLLCHMLWLWLVTMYNVTMTWLFCDSVTITWYFPYSTLVII